VAEVEGERDAQRYDSEQKQVHIEELERVNKEMEE
jgi:hypothetical protein